jgi:hypothetical protein
MVGFIDAHGDVYPPPSCGGSSHESSWSGVAEEMFGGQHRRDPVTRNERGAWTSRKSGDRATAASVGSLAYASRLRRPERRTCILAPPTSLEMGHYRRPSGVKNTVSLMM